MFGGVTIILFAVVVTVGAFLGLYRFGAADCSADSLSCAPPLWLSLPGSCALVWGYLFIAYKLSTSAALKLCGAVPAGAEHAEVRSLLEGVSIAAGIVPPRLYIVEDRAPNAFAVGTNSANAVVAVTDGLLRTLDKRELEGVLAHEVAHIRNNDTRISTFAVLSVSLIATVADLSLRVGFRTKREAGVAILLFGLALYIAAVPAAVLLRAGVSRKREQLADESAVELTRNPAGLRRALEKLQNDSTTVARTTAAVSHLWIESPLQKTGKEGLMGRLLDTHPPIEDRIQRLREYEGIGNADQVDAQDAQYVESQEISPWWSSGGGTGLDAELGE
jgi:heat shock protein HtpX